MKIMNLRVSKNDYRYSKIVIIFELELQYDNSYNHSTDIN
jgi:hypothetical protein